VYSFKRYFDVRSLRIFVLTLAASAVVTGFDDYQAGAVEPLRVLLQSVLIAALVTAITGRRPSDATGEGGRGGQADPGDGSQATGRTQPAMGHPAAESLQEQGITIKLLELIALGDRYGNTFSVAMIGIDHLDEVASRYDAGVTTQLLESVSTALTHTLRMPDRVGEYDHGTYLVVLPETNLPGAIQIAERLRGAISRVDIPASRRVHIHTTASVGVTSYRRGDDLQSMLERATKALRQAQSQGRNRVLPDLAA
jgi:diguanylate cyclase (GGDEF)-like protein